MKQARQDVDFHEDLAAQNIALDEAISTCAQCQKRKKISRVLHIATHNPEAERLGLYQAGIQEEGEEEVGLLTAPTVKPVKKKC